jgi:hypothetical protein
MRKCAPLSVDFGNGDQRDNAVERINERIDSVPWDPANICGVITTARRGEFALALTKMELPSVYVGREGLQPAWSMLL